MSRRCSECVLGLGPQSSHLAAKPVFYVALNWSLKYDIRIKMCDQGREGGLGTKGRRGTSDVREDSPVSPDLSYMWTKRICAVTDC